MNNCPDCMTNENAVGEGIRCAMHEIEFLRSSLAAMAKERDEWKDDADNQAREIEVRGKIISDQRAANAELRETVEMGRVIVDALEKDLGRARSIVSRIGEGHNPHRKCLAPTKCCPSNRLCFPCLANDFLASLPAPVAKDDGKIRFVVERPRGELGVWDADGDWCPAPVAKPSSPESERGEENPSERDVSDAITCVERRLCSTGMPLPCGHQSEYDRWNLKSRRGSI